MRCCALSVAKGMIIKMEKAHLRSIYDEIGSEMIGEVVNAFYPKVYSDPDLLLNP